MNKINSLLQKIKPEIRNTQMAEVFKYNEEISKIPGIIKLTLGEPDFNTPSHIKKAGIKAILQNKSHYTATMGDLKTRRAAAEYLKKYRLNYRPEDEIVITSGVTGGIYAILTSIVSENDEILIPTPVFPLYFPIIKTNKGKIVYINTAPNKFLLSPQMLKKALKEHPNAKAIILNSPSNPTGMAYSKEHLEELSRILDKYNIFVISDEIYSDLIFGHSHFSIARLLPDQTFVLNGLSKSHAMTGWRVGLIAGPAPLISEVSKIHELSVTSITTNSQHAAIEAFSKGIDDSSSMLTEYRKRRDYLYNCLTNMGLSCTKPDGTFYMMAKIPERFEQDDFTFSIQLAKEAKVGVLPLSGFGPGGEGFIRFSYAASMDMLREAVSRLDTFFSDSKL